ncbi:hypothetical protein ACW9KT_00375 [Hymenobacter sp. HD11105]
MRMRKAWWLGSLLLLATACGPESAPASKQAGRRPLYFDIKSFLDAQTQDLTRRKPAVEKRVKLRGGQIETTRVPEVEWDNELQIFYQTDINKPALRGAYQIDSVIQEDGRLRRTYRRKPDVENAVERLTVISLPSAPAAAQEITATLTQDNPLFFSQKRVALHAANGRLLDYQVTGVQKLVLFDTLRYSAAVRVVE